MKQFIRITRHPYEEPYHVNLFVAASNGRQHGEIEIYANVEDLASLARGLRGFPRSADDTVLWELGSEKPEDCFAFYYRLCIRKVTATGQCAVELRFNNNQAPPDREVVEFSIKALPSDLDRLGGLIERFSKLEHRVLEWNITDGELRQDG